MQEGPARRQAPTDWQKLSRQRQPSPGLSGVHHQQTGPLPPRATRRTGIGRDAAEASMTWFLRAVKFKFVHEQFILSTADRCKRSLRAPILQVSDSPFTASRDQPTGEPTCSART